jgi:hypothetical protein
VLIHANGDEVASLITALRVARQAALELEAGTRFHVVVQGPLVRRLTLGGELTEDVKATVSDTVSIVACHNSMDRAGVSDEELLSEVGTVRSAGAYLAARQWDGWAYLRY